MKLLHEKLIVIFGAGKIGRSFVGQLFSCSGYKVVFIDIDQRVISELNLRKQYEVISFAREVMLQAAIALKIEYPGVLPTMN